MNFLRWIFTGCLVSLAILLAGILPNGSTLIGQANAGDVNKPHHPQIVKIESIYEQAQFDLSKKSHLLRNERINFYLAQAKQADLRNWTFKRDALVTRAKNILVHHQQSAIAENTRLPEYAAL
jgi:hypothetical protein